LKGVQTPEELNDVHMHFLLYYGSLIQKMQEKKRAKAREERSQQQQDEQPEQPEEEDTDVIKPAARGGPYAICRKAKLGNVKYSTREPKNKTLDRIIQCFFLFFFCRRIR
jgi:transcription elongation factor SPT6